MDDTKWRHKGTGKVYAQVKFNTTTVAMVRTERSHWYPIKKDKLERLPTPTNPKGESHED